MKKHLNKIIGISLVFLMISCALESRFSLPNDEKIKPELLGEWVSAQNSEEVLKIERNNDKTYKLTIVNPEKTETFIAFSKTINGFNIMNFITEQNGQITNSFYGFHVADSTLTCWEVNNKLRENDFKNETDLLSFFRENVSKKDFFIDPFELKRR